MPPSGDSEKSKELREWLLHTLQPITDADLEALSDYVLALLANDDVPRDQLRDMCNTQLQDFLQEHTESFVQNLFQALDMLNQNGSLLQQHQQQGDQDDNNDMEHNGQTEFRNNFRADRDMNEQYNPRQPRKQHHRHQQQQQEQQGYWSNGVFVPFPSGNNSNIPIPTNQGFFPMPPPPPMPFVPQQQSRLRRDKPGRKKRKDRSDLSSNHRDAGKMNRFLIVERLPMENFNEESLAEYFTKYGTVKKVVLHKKEKVAELEFETHDQAKQAYESPEPIFDNRFVKVFWKVRPIDEKTGEPEIDLESIRQLQEQRQKEFEIKRAERLAKEAEMKKQLEQKAELLKKRQEHQELLLKIAQKEGRAPEVNEKTSNTELLQQKLQELKQEAESLGIYNENNPPSSFRGRGRGGRAGYGFRGRVLPRGRGGGFHPYRGSRGGGVVVAAGSRSLDLRPKVVLVEPVPPNKEEAMQSHLLSVTDIDTINPGTKPDSILIGFKNRRSAEHFFYSDPNISDVGTVQKSWHREEPKPSLSTQSEEMGTRSENDGSNNAMDTGQ